MRWNAAAFGPGYRAVDQNLAAFVRRRGRVGYFFGAIATGVANARHVMRKHFRSSGMGSTASSVANKMHGRP
jgi:hypothetical protein